jgi:tRNA (mo5U34)-methyltransferase
MIYHLRHPLLALQRLHSVCREVMYLESHVLTDRFVGTQARIDGLGGVLKEAVAAEFFPGAELAGDLTNWWSPTRACLEAWLRSHGFEPTFLAEWPSSPGWRVAFRCANLPGQLSPQVLSS